MNDAVILYNSEDGDNHLRLKRQDGTVWLSQAEMAERFQTTPQNITQHIRTLYDDGELDREAPCKDFLHVQTEGGRQIQRRISISRPERTLAVGCRMRRPRGSQFRRRATSVLQEYLRKGFAIDTARLKDPSGLDYFDERLGRIREVPASEKRFYQKDCDLSATAVDYDGRNETARRDAARQAADREHRQEMEKELRMLETTAARAAARKPQS